MPTNPIRRTTALIVSRPPDGRWCFHWHEVVPMLDPRRPVAETYLPALEPGEDRLAVCERLRAAFRESPPERRFTVQEGYLVEVVRDGSGLLPPDVDEAIEDLLQGDALSESA